MSAKRPTKGKANGVSRKRAKHVEDDTPVLSEEEEEDDDRRSEDNDNEEVNEDELTEDNASLVSLAFVYIPFAGIHPSSHVRPVHVDLLIIPYRSSDIRCTQVLRVRMSRRRPPLARR